jgi:hypothetical protein
MNEGSISQTFSAVVNQMHYLFDHHRAAPGGASDRKPAATDAMPEDDLALLRAMIYYAERRRRAQFLPEEIFGEPAWDILLDLFIAGRCGKPVATCSIGLAAAIPATTALRWLDRLEAQALVERERDSADHRRVNVRLTELAHARLKEFFLFDRPSRKGASGASASGDPAAPVMFALKASASGKG